MSEYAESIQEDRIAPNFVEFFTPIDENAGKEQNPFQHQLNVDPFESRAAYVDLTPYFHLPEKQAAKLLGICTSTLSKQWKEVTFGRKWPHRQLLRVQTKCTALKTNLSLMPPESSNRWKMELELVELEKQVEELKSPVFIKRNAVVNNHSMDFSSKHEMDSCPYSKWNSNRSTV